jgi:peroxiredoxin
LTIKEHVPGSISRYADVGVPSARINHRTPTANRQPRVTLLSKGFHMFSPAARAFLFILLASLSLGSLLADEAKGVPVGEIAPDFNLPVVGEDEFLILKDAIKDGPVVVVILRGYPGYQCPLCSQQVGSLANRAMTLSKLTKRVILVYPGKASMLEKHAEQFMSSRTLPEPLILVRDPDFKAVEAYGVRWDAPRESAYPATFVIDKNGRVRWAKISDSHAGRATTDEIVRELRKL